MICREFRKLEQAQEKIKKQLEGLNQCDNRTVRKSKSELEDYFIDCW
ncbi:hypothetical protein [Thermohalobacter berrensis]|nr:hypothetical protein [Thermohalobacter berrensis]